MIINKPSLARSCDAAEVLGVTNDSTSQKARNRTGEVPTHS